MYVFFSSFSWGVEVWVGLFFLKSPGQFISCLFRVTNLSALPLLLYCDAFFASLWQWEPTGVSVSVFIFILFYFFFSFFSAGLSGNDVHSLPSSFILAFSHFPALFFIQHKYLLVPTVMASQHLLCHLDKALSYMHDIELVEIGVWWTMSVCFFSTPPDLSIGGKMGGKKGLKKKKKKKKKDQNLTWLF